MYYPNAEGGTLKEMNIISGMNLKCVERGREGGREGGRCYDNVFVCRMSEQRCKKNHAHVRVFLLQYKKKRTFSPLARAFVSLEEDGDKVDDNVDEDGPGDEGAEKLSTVPPPTRAPSGSPHPARTRPCGRRGDKRRRAAL